MSPTEDLTRLRREYSDRERRLAGSDLYSYFNPAHLFMIQMRQREALKLLRRFGYYPIGNKRVLEVGCGQGGVLLEYLSYGACSSQLHGAELLHDRVRSAHHAVNNLPLTNADGQNLPYVENCFDLVMQFTVFSSILDDQVKQRVAVEMIRVTRKQTGLILWYDYWLNPTNPQTCGIRPAEIKRIFPNCSYEFHKITLAPPITRRLIPGAWGLALFLESLKIFNTHYLVVIQPK